MSREGRNVQGRKDNEYNVMKTFRSKKLQVYPGCTGTLTSQNKKIPTYGFHFNYRQLGNTVTFFCTQILLFSQNIIRVTIVGNFTGII
jgi:hypothetical protein